MEFLAGIAGLEADFTGIRCFEQDCLNFVNIITIIAGNTMNIIARLESDFTGIRN